MDNLPRILEETAQRIVERGTWTESATLCAMSTATRQTAPGAAAALVDWKGSEVARLRAFGIVHGVILRELDSSRLDWLVDQLSSSTTVSATHAGLS